MVAAIAGVAISAYGAYSSSKAAGKSQKSADHAADAQAQLGQDQLAFGKEQYADWKDMFAPVLSDVRDMAYEKKDPDYASVIGDVNTSFDTSQAMNRRQQERYGISPTDGATAASEMQYGLGRAKAQVGAQMTARRTAENDQWNRLTQFLSAGTSMQQTANSTINSGFGNSQNAAGNAMNYYGNQANQYNQAAAAGAAGVGRGISNLGNMWGSGSGGSGGSTVGYNVQDFGGTQDTSSWAYGLGAGGGH